MPTRNQGHPPEVTPQKSALPGKEKSKKKFKKTCQVKNKTYFCTRLPQQALPVSPKQEEHVHRHIELTA